jgi:hypothetical protein
MNATMTQDHPFQPSNLVDHIVGEDFPDYLEAATITDPKTGRKRKPLEWQVQRSILRGWDVKDWQEDSRIGPHGYSWGHHLARYIQCILPIAGKGGAGVEMNEWLERMICAVEETRFGRNMKIVNLIGCQSSGKTGFMAAFTNALVSIDPEYTTSFVAAPYKDVAKFNLWLRIRAMAERIGETTGLAVEVTNTMVNYMPPRDDAGTIQLFASDKVGKLQGVKSVDTLKRRGFMIVNLDEIGEFQNKALLKILENIGSQDNLLVLTGCNFRDTLGLDGELCKPLDREYHDLDIDRDQEWDSVYGSRTYRFDGHLSPNVTRTGRKWYPYLLQPQRITQMKNEIGEHSPGYYCQIRSFPQVGANDHACMDRSRLRAPAGAAR